MVLENSVTAAGSAIEALMSGNATPETPEQKVADQPPETEADVDVQEDDAPVIEEQETTEENEEDLELPEDQETDEPDTEFEIKHNGEIKKLPKSEIIALAQKGFDYDHKAQAVATERKALEQTKQTYAALQSETEQARTKALETNELMQAFLQYQVPTDVDLQKILETEGSEAALQAQLRGNNVQKAINTLRKQREDMVTEQTEKAKQERLVLEQQEREALRNAVPELATPEGTTKLVTYLQGMGYDQEQIAGAIDHRLFVMANKARKYDELIKNRETRKPVQTVPKVTKPTKGRSDVNASQVDKVRQADNVLKKTGKTHDAAAAILARGLN